jgi:hypothetical protein
VFGTEKKKISVWVQSEHGSSSRCTKRPKMEILYEQV